MPERTWTPLAVLDWTTRRFAEAGIASARLDAQVLLAHVLRCDRVALYTAFDKPLAAGELAAYRGLIRRRLAGEPVAYLVGEREFWSVPLAVTPDVLVPRPDTETLVQVALDLVDARVGGRGARADAEVRIADIGTGSGAVAIALARELPRASVVATDVSDAALAVAARNVDRHGVGGRVSLARGDLTAALPAGDAFDLIVANLPYIPTAELAQLPADVRREPRLALDGGADGLAVIARLVAAAPAHLAAGGAIALEHAADQAGAVAAHLAGAGFRDVATHRDLARHPRVTSGARG